MNLKDILAYKVFESESVVITVYKILMALLVIIVTGVFLWGLKRVFKKKIFSGRMDTGKSNTILQLIKYFTWTIAIILALETLGLKITILLAGSAALLVGIGFGLQQIFRDLVSGISILVEGTLKVGDVVEVEGIVGKVKATGIRTTKIETRDNIIIIIPNSKFTSEYVINWSHLHKKTRFKVSVGVAYGSDVQKVKDVLLNCAEQHKDVTSNPKPFVRFEDFGNSSLDFSVYFWTNRSFEVENTRSDIRFSINEAFRKEGITIPFPQRDVHIKSQP